MILIAILGGSHPFNLNATTLPTDGCTIHLTCNCDCHYVVTVTRTLEDGAREYFEWIRIEFLLKRAELRRKLYGVYTKFVGILKSQIYNRRDDVNRRVPRKKKYIRVL